MVVGLTGGIASGKSLVSDILATQSVRIIDADIIARQIVEPGQLVLQQLVEIFGADILDKHGCLDRTLLRQRAFSSEQARQTLNAIMHPAIRANMLSQLAESAYAYEANYRILSVPLLLENNLHHLVDMIVVVDVDEATQLERASLRDQTDKQAISRIMRGQWPRVKRLAFAHAVIDNGGTQEETLAQVDSLHKRLTALAR